jgi:hypothetical protein
MGRKLPVILLVVGVLLLLVGGAMALLPWLQKKAAPEKVVLFPPTPAPTPAPHLVTANSSPKSNPAVPIQVAPAESVHPAIAQQDLDAITEQLQSSVAADRDKALAQIHDLAKTDAKSLSQGLTSWLKPLMDNKLYSDIEQLTVQAIIARASLPEFVENAQRARVMAFMAEGNYPQALKEAKMYYNVASLSGTGDAVQLLTQILAKTNGDPFAKRFQSEQLFAAAPLPAGALNTDAPPPDAAQSPIVLGLAVDAAAYAQTISDLDKNQNGKGQHSYNRIARGNLLLLSDKPEDARKLFIESCRIAKGEKNIRDAVEGVARAMRARDGNVVAANAYILSLRQDAEKNGSDLTPATKGLPTFDDIQSAAQKTTIAEIQMGMLPSLELKRQSNESNIGNANTQVDIVDLYGVDCFTPIGVHQLSSTHFEVSMGFTTFCDWFMFRVNGAAGKTIRIDLTGQGVLMDKWATLNPMVSYVSDLNDPQSYISADIPVEEAMTAWNGTALPSTTGQKWQYVSNVWRERPNALSLVLNFESDSAIVAMRVPYTPRYNERYLKQLASNPLVKIIEVGRSTEGRPLLLAKIGGGDSAEKTKPCILVYSREHADEQDSSWVSQGIIEHLLAETPQAKTLRDQFTVLVIPMLDPDSAEVGRHVGILSSFAVDHPSQESVAYENWFRAWVSAGKRLDLVYNLHNVQSAESPDLACAMIEKNGVRGIASIAVHSLFEDAMKKNQYSVTNRPWQFGWSPDRLGGWLSHSFGPLTLAYEVNAQCPDRHLTIFGLKHIGGILLDTAAEFLNTADGQRALAAVDVFRAQQIAAWPVNGQPHQIWQDPRTGGSSSGSSKIELEVP